MTHFIATALLPPATVDATFGVLDADMDAQGRTLFAVGREKAASHLVFASGASVRLPRPLQPCRTRLLTPESALVWGAMKPHGEANAWIVGSDGAVEQTTSALHYCKDAFCTDRHIVVTYSDDHIGSGYDVAAGGLAVFDRACNFAWGWDSTIRDAPTITHCDAAVALGADRVGVFASYDFPVVELDLAQRRIVALHQPTPKRLHGAHAISRRDAVWYFVGSYEAKECIFAWQPGHRTPKIVGRVPVGQRFRGLNGGRFITIADQSAEIWATA